MLHNHSIRMLGSHNTDTCRQAVDTPQYWKEDMVSLTCMTRQDHSRLLARFDTASGREQKRHMQPDHRVEVVLKISCGLHITPPDCS